VLGLATCFEQAPIKLEREILVEKELQAAFTAGGWWAATCAP
jgi:hypothetical protein